MSETTKKVNIELEVDTNVVNSGINPFQNLIYLARAIDAWRIFPRIFISVYIILLYKVVIWFMELPEPNMEQAGLVSVVVGAGAAWFGLYTSSGKKFEDPAPQQIIVPPTTAQSTSVMPPVMPQDDNRG